MLDRLDAALAALAETVKAINARQDLLAYTQQVASPPAPAPATPSPGSSTGSSSGSSRPLSPFAAAVASPTGGDGEGMDEAAALKAKTAPGIEHMEKCIKTLRAMCHWCVLGRGIWIFVGMCEACCSFIYPLPSAPFSPNQPTAHTTPPTHELN